MPVEVDVTERLAALACATLVVAARRGTEGVTIRAVAAELGGSTTRVTNYLPTRTALLVNAVAHAVRRWDVERAEALAGVPAEQRLVALARWSHTTTAEDAVLRHLLIELAARSEPLVELRPFAAESRRHRDELAAAAVDAGAPDPGHAADVLFLLLRGAAYTAIEQPDRWTPERVVALVEHAVDLVTQRRRIAACP